MKTLINPTAEQALAVGSVIQITSRFVRGGAGSTAILVHLDEGWSPSLSSNHHDLRSWADLTDIEVRNARIAFDDPKSTARYERIEVTVIHDASSVDELSDKLADVEAELAVANGKLDDIRDISHGWVDSEHIDEILNRRD